MHTRFVLFVQMTLALAFSAPGLLRADTFYVDGDLASSCDDYEASARSCGGGSNRAFADLGNGVEALAGGDEMILREGTYAGVVILIDESGTEAQPTTVRGADGETVVIEDVGDPAIFVQGAEHVVVRNLTVQDVRGWARLEDSSFVSVQDCTFLRATSSGTTGSLKMVRADQCTIERNRFIEGNDNIVMQESNRNRIIDNEFVDGRHSLLSVRCSNENVIRGNRFENSIQKAMEIFDCEGVSDAPFRLDDTRRNLIERNRFEGTLATDRDHRYNAIQYAGQNGIVRRNVFFANLGGGLAFQVYSDEALNNYGHHAYHNTFVDNACHAVISSNATSDVFHSNHVRFNSLFGNTDCAGDAVQTNVRNTDAVMLEGNHLAMSDPGFIDAAGRDFALRDGSELVDAAGYLTRTTSAGSGMEISVEDAAAFFAGNGIAAEIGDLIQLEGTTDRARVRSVNVDEGVLVLESSLSWNAGQGVALAFEGSAPDTGAFEHGAMIQAPDAGVTDAGASDAGAGDAGPGDSGVRDVGAQPGDGGPDSNVPDAVGTDSSGGCSVGQSGTRSWALALLLGVWFARRRRG